MTKATFALRGRNPDVLTCIANLSNDAVFTPPEFANRMLDTLSEAWSAGNDGASIWADPDVTFLDPFTKSGVFLREIVKRLTEGLEVAIPDLAQRVEHILTRQVYGIATEQLTALLARRSVYCSKYANGPHSIAKSFETESGNIWFERTEHSWAKGTPRRGIDSSTGTEMLIHPACSHCGAQREYFDRGEGLETHAYRFIHTDDIAGTLADLFGGDMKFDVVIGNPPYQLKGGAGGSSDSSIYQLFVEQAIRLEPRYLSMVIPSRWMVGGRGLDAFRDSMLRGGHLSHLVDYTKASTAFPGGVDFEGGVGFFLWTQDQSNQCEYTLFLGDDRQPTALRNLGSHDVFIRDQRAVGILDKVLAAGEPSVSTIFTNREPFKLESNFRGFETTPKAAARVPIHYIDSGKRRTGYMDRSEIQKHPELIDKWKVLVPKAYGERGAMPAMVLGRPLIASSPSIATGSFLFFYCDSEDEAQSIAGYYATKFFRFLVSLRKITQDAFRPMYSWVPMQDWSRTWSDQDLFEKYGLNETEIEYIESVIRPMGLSNE